MTDINCITSWDKERDWMFAQHNGFSHFSLQLVAWNRSHFSGQGNITRLLVMLIIQMPQLSDIHVREWVWQSEKGKLSTCLEW